LLSYCCPQCSPHYPEVFSNPGLRCPTCLFEITHKALCRVMTGIHPDFNELAAFDACYAALGVSPQDSLTHIESSYDAQVKALKDELKQNPRRTVEISLAE